jgi:hypothetical protein
MRASRASPINTGKLVFRDKKNALASLKHLLISIIVDRVIIFEMLPKTLQ